MFEIFFSPKKNSVLQKVELNFTKPFFFNDKMFLIFGYMMSFSPPNPIPRILEGNFSFKMMMLMLVKQSNALWELWLHFWAWPWEGVETPTLPDAASCAPPGGTHFIGKLTWLHYSALKHWSETKEKRMIGEGETDRFYWNKAKLSQNILTFACVS